MTEKTIEQELRAALEETMKWLEDLAAAEPLEAETSFLETVLEIKRIQSLLDGKWKTTGYEFLVSDGGPNVWIADDAVHGAWHPSKMSIPLSDKAKELIERVESYWDEVSAAIE